MTVHAKPFGAVTTWVVWVNVGLVTFWLLGQFLLLLYPWACVEPTPVDRLRDPVHDLSCFYARKCLLGVVMRLLTIYGSYPPKPLFLGRE